MRFFKDLSLSAFTAGFVAVLVGFTSSVVIVFQAAQAFGATPEMIASWRGRRSPRHRRADLRRHTGDRSGRVWRRRITGLGMNQLKSTWRVRPPDWRDWRSG